jgi:predicted Zn-dependent protease
VKFDPKLPADGINVSGTHPLREAAVLVAGIVGAVVAFAFAVGLAVDRLVPHVPPSWERRLFSWSDAAAPGAGAEDPRLDALRGLLERLVRHWPEAPYEFRARVWNEQTPNALALPGGWIVVTSGLLDRVESENELAFVLGHELGHFAGRDHLRGLGRDLALSLLLSWLGLGGAPDAIVDFAGGLAQRGFDREQESDADAFALALVAAEYGHVAGALDFFERLPDPDGVVARELAQYLSTHPLNDERVHALWVMADERGWARQGAGRPFAGD